jgi:hypothetical protein
MAKQNAINAKEARGLSEGAQVSTGLQRASEEQAHRCRIMLLCPLMLCSA